MLLLPAMSIRPPSQSMDMVPVRSRATMRLRLVLHNTMRLRPVSPTTMRLRHVFTTTTSPAMRATGRGRPFLFGMSVRSARGNGSRRSG